MLRSAKWRLSATPAVWRTFFVGCLSVNRINYSQKPVFAFYRYLDIKIKRFPIREPGWNITHSCFFFLLVRIVFLFTVFGCFTGHRNTFSFAFGWGFTGFNFFFRFFSWCFGIGAIFRCFTGWRLTVRVIKYFIDLRK